MTKQTILLEIVTPTGVCLCEQVAGFTAPSVDGIFGVLPGHQPLLAALKTGIVTFEREGGAEEQVAVGPGFAEVMSERALLLTDKFIRKPEVDAVAARLELKEADAALEHFEGDPGSPEHAELIAKELWAAVKLELYGDPPPPILRTFDEFRIAAREDYVKAFEQGAEAPKGDAAGPGNA